MADAEQEKLNEERRQSFRLDMEKELVDIVWVNDDGQQSAKKIVCLDFSRGGLKLDCDQAIALETSVKVVFKAADPRSQKLSGRVIRCIKQDNGWFEIALQLDE
ncbi:PilZ domain-containing protein [Thalassotalea piscium]|uniref:C-di-GMP-binding flagellar brake protein YcgR n=1 Tax=Thalassotalea piscium TaxID=1230533 RepID=A0A7X0NEN2_9GAMM|nr:PilZ domain-containing protein [Thalassotalea piscium]MBB6542047.1 c-di-GMP-binding flagellar brake protein YcgR [Thalassotalea piscium]